MMFRLFSRSRRLAALLTAAVLGTTPLTAGPAEPVAATRAAAGRADEIEVELAWMADPLLFRVPLRARAADTGLEVSGYVPSSLRGHALKVARKASGVPVHDAFSVSHAPTQPVKHVKSEELIRSASRVIIEVLGPEAKTVQIGAGSEGQLVLNGVVASAEERHTLSMRLRMVRGCSCAINQLRVRHEPGMGSAPEDAGKETARPPREVKPTTPAGKPPTMPRAAAGRSAPIQRVAAWSPYGARPESDSPAPTPAVAGTSTPPAPVARTTSSTYGTSSYAPMPASLPKAERLVPEDEPVPTSKPRRMPVAQSAPPTRDVLPTRPASAAETSMTAPRKLPGMFQHEAAALRPASTPAKTMAAKPSVPDRPYVTTGTVTFHEGFASMPSAPPSALAAPPTVGLRQKLLGMCEGMAKDIRVETKPDATVHVTVRVASDAAIEPLTRKMLQAPEMHSAQYHLAFEVQP